MAKKDNENIEINKLNEEEEIKDNEKEEVTLEKKEENKNETEQKTINESKKVQIKVEIPFTDKYDEKVKYVVGDILNIDKNRAEELLKDKRKLVSLVSE